MTEDEAAGAILTQRAVYQTRWRIEAGGGGEYRDAAPEEAAVLDRVSRTMGQSTP